jgi:hypothetical protein
MMLNVGDLVDLDGLDTKGLRRRYGRGFLLVDFTYGGVLEMLGVTETSDRLSVRSTVEGLALTGARDPLQADVYPLHGSAQDRFMVTVGRGDGAVVRLRHPNVSKVHAFFRFNPDSETFALTDAGSRNGTRVDGVLLEPHAPRPLKGGETIRFGRAVAAQFHTDRSLAGYVAGLKIRRQREGP